MYVDDDVDGDARRRLMSALVRSFHHSTAFAHTTETSLMSVFEGVSRMEFRGSHRGIQAQRPSRQPRNNSSTTTCNAHVCIRVSSGNLC
jgi:hypothetical protein